MPLTDRDLNFLERIRKDWRLLTHVSYLDRTYLHYGAALCNSSRALKEIPPDQQGKAAAIALIMDDPDGLYFFRKEYLFRDLCQYLMTRKGRLLGMVPSEFRDYGVCKAAARNDGMCIGDIPTDVMDRKLMLTCLRQNRNAIGSAAVRHRPVLDDIIANHPESAEMLLKYSGTALEFFPESQRSPERCRIAVESDGFAVEHVPKSVLADDPDLCLTAVRDRPLAVGLIPESMLTQEVCDTAFAGDMEILEYIPVRFQTDRMWKWAEKLLVIDGIDLVNFPEKARTPERCRMAVASDGTALKYVPGSVLENNPDLCLLAVMNRPLMLRHIPEDMLTQEICNTAFAGDIHALEYIPARFQTDRMREMAEGGGSELRGWIRYEDEDCGPRP